MTAADNPPPLHGPYDDVTTAREARHAADVIRYLNYATAQDGITQPATVATVTGHLADVAGRLPQMLTQVSAWLHREITAGNVASDHGHSAAQLAATTRDQLHGAAEQADRLAQALDVAHQVTSALHGTQQAEDRR